MKFSVRCKYRKGVRLQDAEVLASPACTGDLRTEFELDDDSGQMVLAAKLHGGKNLIDSLLPDLRHVHLVGFSLSSFTLHGMEAVHVGGQLMEVRQEWWVSEAGDGATD